ncbi:MAG: universal stress protein [Deltaproteobacteria bacterium]|nr:universal stress protein [Deltaproteobacteria bacterium]
MGTFDRILVPTDFSGSSRAALLRATAIAHAFGSSIDVVHCGADEDGSPEALADKLEAFMREVDSRGIELARRVVIGAPAEAIIQDSKSYDLIVMGTHGRVGLERMILGSVAERVVREAFCPVLTVKDFASRPGGERIIYALFDRPGDVAKAREALAEVGVLDADVSIFVNDARPQRDFELLERSFATRGLAAGGLLGGTIGGIVGGLVSLGAASGLVGLLVMGPAVAFAAAGGIAGGLIGWGVPEDTAKRLQKAVQDGRLLLAVHARDSKVHERAQKILFAFDGETIEVPR